MMRMRLLASTVVLCLMNGDALAAEEKRPPLKCGTIAYPAEPAAYGLEGTTTVEYQVTPDGRVADLSVKRSSGWRMLDEATLDILAGCRLAQAPSAEVLEKRQTIQYVWSLDAAPSRQALVPGSCTPSDRIAGFRALDIHPSAADGILVRAMIGAGGDPYYVKAEGDTAPADATAIAVAYLRSCRFALPPGERSPKDEAIFGRVLLK